MCANDIDVPVGRVVYTQWLNERGGIEAMQLRIGEEYVRQFGKLAKESTTLVVPGNLSDLASVVTMATSIVKKPSPTPASP